MQKVKKPSDFTSIKHWRNDERPREKYLQNGGESLSDSELLALIIRTGTSGKSAIDISRILLNKFKSFTEMAKADVSEFTEIEGIGDAKAVIIAAIFEISRRIVVNPVLENRQIKNASDVADYYLPKLRDLRKESFRILLLSQSNKIFREVLVSEGTLNQTLVHAREIFRSAIVESAASIILIHNHPSGNCEPSIEDKAITKKLVDSGELIGIKVLDHLIFAPNEYFSFKKAGLIK